MTISEKLSGNAVKFFMILLILGVVASSIIFINPQPEKKITTIDGEKFSLRDFKGKIVLIDFMATWCRPCWNSMPWLLELYNDYHEEVVFISISIDPINDNDETLNAWRDMWGAEWIHAIDLSDPPMSQEYQIFKYPTFVLINENGGEIHRSTGSNAEKPLREAISSLLNRQ
jgi:thiol-disulfide isomerase/thioredoxin